MTRRDGTTWVELAAAPAFIAGAIGLVAAGIGAFLVPEDFFRGYLLGFLFWAGMSLGALGLMLMHVLTGGDWGVALRRPFESAVQRLPLLALAFVPIVLGFRSIYPWGVPGAALSESKHIYFALPFFVGRTAVYFIIWLVVGYVVIALRRRQDERFDAGRASRLRGWGGLGAVLWVLAVSFAGFDWMMSLDTGWFSTIYGFYVLSGFALGAMALMVLVVAGRSPTEPEQPLIGRPSPGILHDFGNLLFMLIFFYAYIAFSQFIIIWSGNLPEEAQWYATRRSGAWAVVPYVLAVGHFALPFCILLSRRAKRRPDVLMAVAGLLLVMRGLDLSWMVMPAFPRVGGTTWLMALASWVGIGGIWFSLFARRLGTHSTPAAVTVEHA
jgi:hypothetical protein